MQIGLSSDPVLAGTTYRPAVPLYQFRGTSAYTLKQWSSTGGSFVTQETFGNLDIWKHFWLSELGVGVLLASSRCCRACQNALDSATRKNNLEQNVSSAKVNSALKSHLHHVCEVLSTVTGMWPSANVSLFIIKRHHVMLNPQSSVGDPWGPQGAGKLGGTGCTLLSVTAQVTGASSHQNQAT